MLAIGYLNIYHLENRPKIFSTYVTSSVSGESNPRDERFSNR